MMDYIRDIDIDWKAFLKSPIFIMRCLTAFFCLIVAATVPSCYIYDECLFAKDASACGFGSFLGVFGILLCIGFIGVDIMFSRFSANMLPIVARIDLVVCGVMSFFNFVGFCLLTNRWNNTDSKWLDHERLSYRGPQTVIAFCFFAILSWLCNAYIAFQRSVNTEKFFFTNAPGGTVDTDNYVDPGGVTYPGFTSDVEPVGARSEPTLPMDK